MFKMLNAWWGTWPSSSFTQALNSTLNVGKGKKEVYVCWKSKQRKNYVPFVQDYGEEAI